MTIYVNKPGTKFIKAQDCSDAENFEIHETLKDEGYQLPFDVYKEGDNSYTQLPKFLKKHLTLYQKVQLCNLLAKSWKVCPINIRDNYEEYMSWHIGDKDYGYKDFFKELETGDEAILDSCDEALDNIHTYKEYCVVFDYLDAIENPKHWHSWLIRGFAQGEVAWVWFYDDSCDHDFNQKFKDNKLDSFYGDSIEEVLTEAIYGSFISLTPCDNKGMSNCEQINDQRVIAGFYIGDDDSLSNKSDKYVDEYMLKEYGMKPALVDVTYMS